MNTEFWMCKALEAVGRIETNTAFVLKDLFEGVEWNQLPKGDRLSFGRFFKNKVIEGMIPSVSHKGKAANNSTLYLKNK